MYLSTEKVIKIINAAQEIKRLATLETCEPMTIQWFDAEADEILDVLNEHEENCRRCILTMLRANPGTKIKGGYHNGNITLQKF